MHLFYCITIPAGIGLATISRGPAVRSGFQEDGQRLLVGDLRSGLELRQGATADRMLNAQEGIAGQAEDAGDVPRRHLERYGAEHYRPLAELFEADAVVQTAR